MKPVLKQPKKSPASVFKNFAVNFQASVKTQSQRLLDRFATDFRDEIRTAIRDQTYRWKPLSPKYAQEKERKSLDPRIYIATGFFLSHIAKWKTADGIIHVGLRPRVMHPDANMPLTRLAKIHEFGVSRPELGIVIPARPVWRPAISKIKRSRKAYGRLFSKYVKADLGRKK